MLKWDIEKRKCRDFEVLVLGISTKSNVEDFQTYSKQAYFSYIQNKFGYHFTAVGAACADEFNIMVIVYKRIFGKVILQLLPQEIPILMDKVKKSRHVRGCI